MPHLTYQLSALGPLLDLRIAVSTPRAEALLKAGIPVPPPVMVRALVDTGASCTCLDPSVISALGLTPSGSVPIHTPSTSGAPVDCHQFDVQIVLVHPGMNRVFHAMPVIQTALLAQGIQGLVGRDVLADCLLVYNGSDGLFTLSF